MDDVRLTIKVVDRENESGVAFYPVLIGCFELKSHKRRRAKFVGISRCRVVRKETRSVLLGEKASDAARRLEWFGRR